MSLADTECIAESVSAVFLHAINSPVMQPPSPSSLPVTEWSSERKQVGEGVEKETGRRGGKEGWRTGKGRDDLHI